MQKILVAKKKKRIYGLCQGLLLYTTFESLPAGIQVPVNVRVKYSLSMPCRHTWGVEVVPFILNLCHRCR
jgi:hypothetical protein